MKRSRSRSKSAEPTEVKSPKSKVIRNKGSSSDSQRENTSNNHMTVISDANEVETVAVPNNKVIRKVRARSQTPIHSKQVDPDQSVEDTVSEVENQERQFNDKIQVSVRATEAAEFDSENEEIMEEIEQDQPNADEEFDEDSEENDESVIHFKQWNNRKQNIEQEFSDLESDEDEDIKQLKQNPAFKKYLNKIAAKNNTPKPVVTPKNSKTKSKTPEKSTKPGSDKRGNSSDIIKSPSDTTVNVPGLKKAGNGLVEGSPLICNSVAVIPLTFSQSIIGSPNFNCRPH